MPYFPLLYYYDYTLYQYFTSTFFIIRTVNYRIFYKYILYYYGSRLRNILQVLYYEVHYCNILQVLYYDVHYSNILQVLPSLV